MIKQILLSLTCLAVIPVSAQKTPVWQDPNVNQVNREVRRADFFAFESEELAKQGDKMKSSRYLSMGDSISSRTIRMHRRTSLV